MPQQVPINPSARADDPQEEDARDDGTHEVTSDVAYLRLGIVNVVFYGPPEAGDRGWTLIDTGLPGMGCRIANAAAQRFGKDARPAAIILTHGHFDHVSTVIELSEQWDAPVYAHAHERPYLDGSAAYPPPDPKVGGGLMSLLSPLYPRGPIDISRRLIDLPTNGSIPTMPGWRWLHTPGHAPGHISLWCESDRTLIAGDAFVTTAQESIYAAATQRPELHGPPMYFTPDWQSAQTSVEALAALEPEIAVTGHGRAMRGAELREALHILARDFEKVAVPDKGKYVLNPAQAADGSAYVPKEDRKQRSSRTKPISRLQHAFLDYPYIAAVSTAPEFFGFAEEKKAVSLCRMLTTISLVSSIFTKAEWGFLRVMPYKAHLAIDTASGIMALAAPWLFGFSQNTRARNTFLAMGMAGLIAGLLSDPKEMPEEDK